MKVLNGTTLIIFRNVFRHELYLDHSCQKINHDWNNHVKIQVYPVQVFIALYPKFIWVMDFNYTTYAQEINCITLAKYNGINGRDLVLKTFYILKNLSLIQLLK